MPTLHRHARGFTLVELLIVIGIIAALMGLVLGVLGSTFIDTKERAARIQLMTISMSATSYTSDWNDFPPFDPAAASTKRRSAELLHDYLCLRHVRGEGTVCSGFPTNDTNVQRGPGLEPALISPLHGFYTFGFEGKGDRRVQWVIVDPGRDKLLGGTMDAENGFVPDNSDANGDGKPDHLDNLIEKVSMR